MLILHKQDIRLKIPTLLLSVIPSVVELSLVHTRHIIDVVWSYIVLVQAEESAVSIAGSLEWIDIIPVLVVSTQVCPDCPNMPVV